MLMSGDAHNLVSDVGASFLVDGTPRPGATSSPGLTSSWGTTSGNDALSGTGDILASDATLVFQSLYGSCIVSVFLALLSSSRQMSRHSYSASRFIWSLCS